MHLLKVFGFLVVCNSFQLFGQQITEQGAYYGVTYENGPTYAAIFDRVVIKGFFVYGKKEGVYYNLSRQVANSHKAYKKFTFDLLDRLLVVGETVDGKMDLMDETGQYYYMQKGNYSAVRAGKKRITYANDKLLLLKSGQKLGVYDWEKKEEIVPPIYDKLKVHESCEAGDYFIFTQLDGLNEARTNKGKVELSFSSAVVDDIYPSPDCRGYMLKKGTKMGYCYQISKDKFFLIKPRYDEILFPSDDPDIIFVVNRGKYGLYYKFISYLKCRYDKIELMDHDYILAKLTRKGRTRHLHQNGKIID
ncbi:MAG: hypothetical protein WDZ35_00795 [Crocinitomicaceae bacterium]